MTPDATAAGPLPPARVARLEWRAARVVEVRVETPQVRTLVLEVPGWPGHLAGQHVDLRLTAEDGYQAQRSYSIASAPGEPHVELTVERLDDGEVSPYLSDVVQPGDRIELRGPIGGYFVWRPQDATQPLALVAGGSGVVPLMAMLRHRARHRASGGAVPPASLLFSARTAEELVFRGELDRLASEDPRLRVAYTLTRAQPPAWRGHARRIDPAMLADALPPAGDAPRIYVCGPTPMVESVATQLVALGHAPAEIRTERFGPSGGP